MRNPQPLHGLVAAVHTPFLADGSLHLAIVERQAAFLEQKGVRCVFVGGTTGEYSSMTVPERLLLAERWLELARGSSMRVVVHVGANCLSESRELARHSGEHGACAISALAPSYFKPRTVSLLVDFAAGVASAAPETPFYYYDIPSMTGVGLPMADFLEMGRERIPTLAGIKFTNPDLMAYQTCLHADDGRWDLPYGCDEQMLGALAMGARGAVGSGFNFAPAIYRRLMDAFERGDMAAARAEQYRGVRLIQLFSSLGYMGAAKAAMQILGVDVGPARLPNATLDIEARTKLHASLDRLGFFDWISS